MAANDEDNTQGAPGIASDSANFPSVFSVCYDGRGVACPSVNKVPLTELIVPRRYSKFHDGS